MYLWQPSRIFIACFFFFFNDTATTEIYTLSLHDALPISSPSPTPLPHWRYAPVSPSGREGEEIGRSTRLNSSHLGISYAVFCLKKKKRPRVPTVSSLNSDNTSNRHCLFLTYSAICPFIKAGLIYFSKSFRSALNIFFLRSRRPPRSTLFPYTTLFR